MIKEKLLKYFTAKVVNLIMDMATVSQLVGTLGFPIVACCALYYQLNKSNERHTEDMNKLSEAVNNNTLVLTKLLSKLGGDDK
jgi:hypothetical protein